MSKDDSENRLAFLYMVKIILLVITQGRKTTEDSGMCHAGNDDADHDSWL